MLAVRSRGEYVTVPNYGRLGLTRQAHGGPWSACNFVNRTPRDPDHGVVIQRVIDDLGCIGQEQSWNSGVTRRHQFGVHGLRQVGVHVRSTGTGCT